MPALGPSALATGCFPCLILTTGLSCAVAYALITSISHNSSIDLTEMIFVLFFSIITSMVLFPIGSGYGLVMGAFAVSLAGLFHWSCYARIPRRVLMQLVGGATGYWSVIFLIELSSDKRDVMLIPGRFAFGWTVALFSMLWGMLFNAVQHRRKTARMRRLQTIKLSPPVDSPTPPIQWQFGVRDTMIIVTWVAALSAILRCASISLLLAFLIWLIAQPIALVTGVFLARTLARRGAVHNVIRPQHRL